MHRMKWFAAALVVVAAVLVVAAPASADSMTPTGTRIGLFAPPTAFPANTPFYVRHGFVCPLGTGMVGNGCQLGTGSFSLYVDGVLQPSTKLVENQDGAVGEGWLTNFPNGLPAADHVLMGIWTVKGDVVLTAWVTITFT